MEAQRLKQIREELRYTQQGFAKLLGVPTSTSDLERGKTKIPGYVVMELLRQFRLNPLWLYGHSEQKYLSETSADVSPKVISVDAAENENIVLVHQKAAAGYPHNIHDVGWYERLPAFGLPLPQFQNATYRGFQVEGDSMLPGLHPSDWVIARAVPHPRDLNNNRVHVVVTRESVLVKKVEKINENLLRLHAHNPEYEPLDISLNQIQELWQVTGKISFGIEEDNNSFLLRQLQHSMQELKEQLAGQS